MLYTSLMLLAEMTLPVPGKFVCHPSDQKANWRSLCRASHIICMIT